MKMKSILGLIILLFTISCGDNPSKKEKEFLNKNIENLGTLSNSYKWIIILPGVGCHGCIQDGEFFMKKNIHRNDILFIITKVSSIKILQQKTGIELKKQQNIFIDKKNVFDIPSENSIYPCVIKIEKGKIIDYAFQKPQSDAFQLLK